MELFCVVLARLGEKTGKIDEICTVIELFEAYAADNFLVAFVGFKIRLVHVREVYEIEGGSSENEKHFFVFFTRNARKVDYMTALVVYFELTYAGEAVVEKCRIGEKVGVIFHAAPGAYGFLLVF